MNISKNVITYNNRNYDRKNIILDRILTNKFSGFLIMGILMMFIFWLTIVGSNYPSNILFNVFSNINNHLEKFLIFINCPNFLVSLFVDGIFKTLGWVVSVMLPPMAIFFPLFTLLEDFGILPRIAFNMDKIFSKCSACGKQSLCMMMGFGCNAAGVVGSRIIDSKRERLISILTNSLIPCNGRFPSLILIISIFMVGSNQTSFSQVFYLTMIIMLGIAVTFIVSFILSKTILKGYASSFTLELPPYRRPQVLKVIVRSVFDKTLHILGRSVIVTIPVGILIWLLTNISINNTCILTYINNFFDPFGKIIGLDGIIITAFLLGFPANEIVIPIMLMSYLKLNTLIEYDSLIELKKVLLNNNWTILTAINMLIMILFHFPCATTCLTIRKETSSNRWMFIAMIIPMFIGIMLCLITKFLFYLF